MFQCAFFTSLGKMVNVEFFWFQSNNFCIWSCELLNKAKVNRLLFVDYLVAIDLERELTSLQLLDKVSYLSYLGFCL